MALSPVVSDIAAVNLHVILSTHYSLSTVLCM